MGYVEDFAADLLVDRINANANANANRGDGMDGTGYSMEAPRVGSLEMVSYASLHAPADESHRSAQQAGAITESKGRGIGRTDDVTDEWLRSAVAVPTSRFTHVEDPPRMGEASR